MAIESGTEEVGGPGWEPFKYDPLTGMLTEIKVEPVGDKHSRIHVRQTFMACNQLFDLNAERRASTAGRGWGDGQVAASIPLNMFYDKLAQPVREGDQAYIKRMLNDSDFSKLRTKEGTV